MHIRYYTYMQIHTQTQECFNAEMIRELITHKVYSFKVDDSFCCKSEFLRVKN